ncbi:MAG: response regulator, partial [Actinobacteria bacterium]|nr:response regulator [Actinomycetota bacterium]
LPIIFVTAADSAADIHSGFRMGADDYIVKPFDPEELSWRVRTVLRRGGHAVAQVWECGDLRRRRRDTIGYEGRFTRFPHRHRVQDARRARTQPHAGGAQGSAARTGVGI